MKEGGHWHMIIRLKEGRKTFFTTKITSNGEKILEREKEEGDNSYI